MGMEEKPSGCGGGSADAVTISNYKDVSSESIRNVASFFKAVGVSAAVPPELDSNSKDFFSRFIRGLLKVQHIERRHVSCILSVKLPAMNVYGGLHGGAVASVAEVVSIACARTVVGKDKEFFLGELSVSYLSSALCDAEVIVDASVVRSGRNLTVIAVEFKVKESGHLAYTACATFYNMPVSSL